MPDSTLSTAIYLFISIILPADNATYDYIGIYNQLLKYEGAIIIQLYISVCLVYKKRASNFPLFLI